MLTIDGIGNVGTMFGLESSITSIVAINTIDQCLYSSSIAGINRNRAL